MLKKRIFIGRNEDSDIVVPAVFNVVSGSHADLKLLDSGEYIYSDHSTNGSTVKGKNIRNEAVTVSFGTPIILATRYALDWELVRQLLPPVPATAQPSQQPQQPPTTQLQQPDARLNDWRPSHPADFTPAARQPQQPAYDRSSHIDPRETRRSNDPRETRLSSDRETRMSNEPATPGRDRHTYAVSGMDIAAQELQFRAGDLFDGRFLLVRNIGAGASATVWEAQDTKTGGLKVAIKIFSLKRGMDSYGFQNLQREFTTVFNFTQQYLLTPSFYDVCEGRPYLVMRYCERGSAAKLIGRATELDVIKLLHDVASGLEYLHEKNIIHQDIKPDNILRADNGDFMITDFGISATIDALNGDAGMSGGTRAYMGPERFNGQNVSGSDIWSLGATAYELVTGDAPYGDHGGMMQSYGTTVPPIAQRLQPEVKDIIMRCLEKDPSRRPTAAEIRKKTDIYYETGGSWQRKNKAKTILLIAAAATLLLALGAGLWIWDYNRVKTSYYAAVTEVYGEPQGVGKVNHSHRYSSIMLQKRRGKVIRMANVNSTGKVVGFNDTENQLRYFPDTHYEYGQDGSLKLKKVYNEYGHPIFSVVMDIKKDEGTGSAAFARFYDQNTPMLLPDNINQSFKDNNFYTNYSAIYKYDYTYDSDGYVKEVRYKSFDTRPVADQYGIGGIKYKYNDRGLITSQQYIDTNGKPTCDNNGLSTKKYEYDDMGNIVCFTMLNINKGPAHDGTHCPVVKHETDQYGNYISESYYDLKGKPVVRTDMGYASITAEYDKHGHRVVERYFDKKGKPVENKAGVASAKIEYNDDGFEAAMAYFDAKGRPVKAHGSVSSEIRQVTSPTGETLELRRYDENGKPHEDTDGVYMVKMEYDDNGNTTSIAFYDKKEKPIDMGGLYHKQVREYDRNNDCVAVTHYDKKGNRATNDGIVSRLRMKYNPWGAVVEILYFNPKDKPTRDARLVAGVKYEYSSENGKQVKATYVDRDGKTPTMSISDEYAICEVEYNSIGQPKHTTYKDHNGKTLRTTYVEVDGRGNYIKLYTMANGKLQGEVMRNKYDDSNNCTEIYYTNLNGQAVNGPNGPHKLKMKYDEMGNYTERTCWGPRGERATIDGCHKDIYVYDRFGQLIDRSVSDASGRPVLGVSGMKTVYDDDGNEIENSWYDKGGRLAVPVGGTWAKQKKAYDNHGNCVKVEYFDKHGRPVEVEGICKYENSYDDRNNLVKQKRYNSRGLAQIRVVKYNAQSQEKEEYVTDASNHLIDNTKVVLDYESDGVTPKVVKMYSSGNRVWCTIPWDDKDKEWDYGHARIL